MGFLGLLTVLGGYMLVYAGIANKGRFALNPWRGLFEDAYTSEVQTTVPAPSGQAPSSPPSRPPRAGPGRQPSGPTGPLTGAGATPPHGQQPQSRAPGSHAAPAPHRTPSRAPTGGYVDPVRGFTLGRTDEGVDVTGKPGQDIRAIGPSKLVQIRPNWYAGQPLLLFQFTGGPKAGQYWYVAEQITPHVTVGQNVSAGQVIGTYAPTGTRLELGYGSPSAYGPGLGGPIAAPVYHEGQYTQAGLSFGNLLKSLGFPYYPRH